MAIVTDFIPIYGDGTTTGRYVPMTGPLESSAFRYCRFAGYQQGNVRFKFAIQFSHDGVVWVSNIEAYDGTNWAAPNGTWTYGTVRVDTYGLANGPRRFVRFGMYVTYAAGSSVVNGMARLRVEPEPFAFVRTLDLGPLKIHADNTMTYLFHPVGAPIPSEYVEEARVGFAMDATTGSIYGRCGYQASDTPDDPASWGSPTWLTSDRSTNGVDYPTTFTPVSTTLGYLRFGFGGKLITGTDVRAALASGRVDLRRA